MDKSIKATLKAATDKLKSISDSPALDAELLLAHCLDKNRTYLHTWPEKVLSTKQQHCYSKLIDKRSTDYPVAYLLGEKAFWSLDLIVTPDVLIPRPETELLVELALEKVTNIHQPKILDLGTGSGAIALAIASERTDAHIYASDFSLKALEIAKQNAVKNQLLNNVTFIQSNWLNNIIETDFDLILSNPPYIKPTDPHLLETIQFEPRSALVADGEGFNDIKQIIQKSKNHLKKGGFLLIEHGFDQKQQCLSLYRQAGFSYETNTKDLNGQPRISSAQWV